jgi:hypothetical protein
MLGGRSRLAFEFERRDEQMAKVSVFELPHPSGNAA